MNKTKRNETKHTPGPWSVEKSNLGPEIWNQNTRVARVNINHEYHADMVDDQANARLIAAAPELLEALEAILEAMPAQMSLDGEQLRSDAIAAIRKATGGDR